MYLRKTEGSAPIRLGDGTGAGDGGWIHYSVQGGQASPIRGLTEHMILIGWRSDNRSLFALTHRDNNKTLLVSILDPATGKITPWKEIRPTRPVEQVGNLQITPDGRAFAYNYLVKNTELYVGQGILR